MDKILNRNKKSSDINCINFGTRQISSPAELAKIVVIAKSIMEIFKEAILSRGLPSEWKEIREDFG